MKGPNGVRDAVADLLRVEVPRKIPLLRTAWGLDDAHLPALDVLTSGERPDNTLDTRGKSWVDVINPRKLRAVRVDIDTLGNPVYRTRWSARIYVWALADEWDTSIAARDNLMAALTASLMEYPTLTIAGGDTGYLLHENTITEEAGEPIRIGGRGARGANPRCWCPGVLSYEIDSEETLVDGSTRPPLGVAETITISADLVGPAVAFPEEDTP